MSLLSKLNPLNWIKELLISDYVGSMVRHALTALGSILVSQKLGSVDLVNHAVESLIKLLTSPEFVSGVVALFSGAVASVANKKAV